MRDDAETSATIRVFLGITEADAIPSTVVVYSPLTQKKGNKIWLNLNAYSLVKDERQTPITSAVDLKVQTPFFYGLVNLLNMLFGLPALTGVTSVLGILKYLWDAAEKRKQEVNQLIQKIDNLHLLKHRLELAVLELFEDANKGGQGERLRQYYRKLRTEYQGQIIWGETFRDELARRLRDKKNEELPGYLQKIQQGLDFPEKDAKSLQMFYQWAHSNDSPGKGESEQKASPPLDDVVRTFQLIGFPVLEQVIDVLRKKLSEEEFQILSEKGATGRFLVWKSKIVEAKGYPPNPVSGTYWLWPSDIALTLPSDVQKTIKSIWEQPFGPLKAEDDPRLPPRAFLNDKRKIQGLFFEGAPLWEKVSSDNTGCYVIAPGMGTSALIGMGCWERRFWGRKPGFSVHLQLSGRPDREMLMRRLAQAVGESLILNLVEDPFWFLTASEKARDVIGRFLRVWSPDLELLMKTLVQAGLPVGEHVLMYDALHSAWRSDQLTLPDDPALYESIRRSMRNACGPRLKSGSGPGTFFWVELHEQSYVEKWIDLMAASGIVSLGKLKLFVVSRRTELVDSLTEKFDGRVDVLMRWNDKDIAGLLNYRVEKVGWNNQMLETLIGTSQDLLVQGAQRSPRQLMALGNEKALHLGEG